MSTWLHCPGCSRAVALDPHDDTFPYSHCERRWLIVLLPKSYDAHRASRREADTTLRYLVDHRDARGLAWPLGRCAHRNAVKTLSGGWWCPDCDVTGDKPLAEGRR